MWFRCSTVAILLFCVSCKPATSEGTPYSSNMTGFDSGISSEKPPAEDKVETTPTVEPAADAPPTDAKPPETDALPTDAVMPTNPEVEKPPSPATDATASAADATTPTSTTQTTALAPDKTLPRKPGVQDLTFDDIAFEMEKGDPFTRSLLPPKIEELGNQKVRIRGYILPSYESRGIKQFVLVRDNMECCFGPGAALFDCILVEMKGPGVDFTVRPVTVEGIFEVKEYKGADGKHLAIYRMEGESAK